MGLCWSVEGWRWLLYLGCFGVFGVGVGGVVWRVVCVFGFGFVLCVVCVCLWFGFVLFECCGSWWVWVFFCVGWGVWRSGLWEGLLGGCCCVSVV